jgi:hypothetical protein
MTNRSSLRRLMLLGLCIVISGCVQAVKMLTPAVVPLASERADKEAKRFLPQRGKASIYVIREDVFAGQDLLFQVSLDGKEQGKLSRGTFFLFTVPPGEHIINAGGTEPGRDTEKIYAVEGGIYYLEIRPKSGLMGSPAKIFRIDLKRGRQMILEGKRAEVQPAE